MKIYDEVIIDFEIPKPIKTIIKELEKIYNEAKKYKEGSEEHILLECEFDNLICDLEITTKAYYRANKISVSQGNLLISKYEPY